VQVELSVPGPAHPEAPAAALVVSGGKTMVAVVQPDSRILLRPVPITGNDGRIIAFGSVVTPGDRLALNLGSASTDGARIQVDSSPGSGAAPVSAGTRGTEGGR